MFERFIARQLAHPSGLVGRLFTSRWLDRVNLAMNELTLRQLGVGPEDKVLEVGFGGGDLLEKILTTTKCEYVAGVDVSVDMVSVVSRRLRRFIRTGQAEVRSADVASLPYRDKEFTKLCGVNTLYFWRDPSIALRECRRVLKQGGRILLCFNAKDDLVRWPPHKHGFRLYEAAEVEALLRHAGFATIETVSDWEPSQGLFYCVSGVVA